MQYGKNKAENVRGTRKQHLKGIANDEVGLQHVNDMTGQTDAGKVEKFAVSQMLKF